MNRFDFLLLVILMSCKPNEKKIKEQDSIKISSNQEKEVRKDRFGTVITPIHLSDDEWKKKLSADQYYVLRQKGTERAFSSTMHENKKAGLYLCGGCDLVLFNSNAKFDSGTGWPSFFRPEDKAVIKEDVDYDLGYARTEVMCYRCGGHLGHVFPDGPKPTGLRYCINAVSLKFIEAQN
jgi:peptide-methionine (R)-S-oxide reductase